MGRELKGVWHRLRSLGWRRGGRRVRVSAGSTAGSRTASGLIGLVLVCQLALGAAAVRPTPAYGQDAAAAAWNAGDMDRAARLYAERVAADSTNTLALHRLALIRAWNRRFEESLELFDRLLRMDPDDLEARRDRARVLGWAGHLERAIEELDGVLARERDEVLALEARAHFRRQAGDLSGALSDFRQIESLRPDGSGTARERAEVLVAQARMEDAAAVYDSLLREDPEDRDARLRLARVLSWAGRLDTATAVYSGALERDPGNVDARMGLARVRGWQGDLVASERHWREVLDEEPDNVSARVGLARTLRWEGRPAAARATLRPAADSLMGEPEVAQEWAWIQAGLAPTVAPGFTYEGDSDGNRIYTARLDGGVRIVPRLELRAESHYRWTRNDRLEPDPGDAERSSRNGLLELGLQLEPGWWIRAGAGAAYPDSAADSEIPRWRASVASPGHLPVVVSLGYRRDALDLTSQLIRNAVAIDEIRVGVRVRPGSGWDILASVAPAWYDGLESNSRLAGSVAVRHEVSPHWTLGASYFALGFDEDLNEGYFDPDYYGLTQAIVRWQANPGDWHLLAEANPGLQQVGAGAELKGAARLLGRVGRRLGPGRQIDLTGAFLSTGMTSFSTGASDYRYGRMALTVHWAF